MPEDSNLLQQMYLTRAELDQLFTSNINKEQQSARLTLKALLETTSTPNNNFMVYLQKHVKVASLLPQKPVLPDPNKSILANEKIGQHLEMKRLQRTARRNYFG